MAFIVDHPDVAVVSPRSFAYSSPAYDFWRPVGDADPSVDGQLSLDCYKQAATECFRALGGGSDPGTALRAFHRVCFHVPFPKMVKKTVMHLGREFGWSDDEADQFFGAKVGNTLEWNRLSGNAYTASLWFSVACSLAGAAEGTPIAASSYGSGFGAELLTLRAGPNAAAGRWRLDIERDVHTRQGINAAVYEKLRGWLATARAS